MIRFFLDPFNLFWLLLVGIVVNGFFKRNLWVKWLSIFTVIWFLVISTPLIPNLVLNSLEDRYIPINVDELEKKEAEYHILVLGGGHGFDDRLPPNSLLSRNALGRLNEGIRIYTQLPNSKLVLSGFSGSGRTTQAEMLQQTALLLGVDRKATIIQKEPRNTYEEANYYSKKFGTSHPLIIVTSAAHMQRAIEVFRYFGTDPIPSPTNYRLKGSWKQKWFGLPAIDNIENLRAGISEYAGIFWYRLGM